MRSLITLFTIRLKIRLLNYYENSRRIIFHQVFPQSRAFREKCKSIKNYVIYAMEVPPWHDDIWWQASQSKNKPNPIPCSMQFSVYGILNKKPTSSCHWGEYLLSCVWAAGLAKVGVPMGSLFPKTILCNGEKMGQL